MAEPEAPRTLEVSSYTEAAHTVYADVAGHPPIQAGSRSFTPRRITIKYHWRTQLGDQGWQIGNIEISGYWIEPENPGSGMVILSMTNAPRWAREMARAYMPRSVVLVLDGADGEGHR